MKHVLLIFVFFIAIIFLGCDNATTKANTAPGEPQTPSPASGATNINIMPELHWSCVDQDGNSLTYTVYMGKNTTSLPVVASGLTVSYFQPGTLDYSQKYYWKVRASDGSETTMGQRWDFTTIAEDIPPSIPSSPVPANASVNISLNPLFRWYCYDNNGDAISYDLYLDTNDNPQIFAENIGTLQYQVNDLLSHTIYYWKIVAKSSNLTTEGPVWSFETGYGNYPPDVPSEPSPEDGDTDISTHTELTWECDDHEGDALHYDIYIGIESDPPLVEQGLTDLSYFPEELESSTTYYWRIDAYDAYSHTLSPIWHFTTGAPNNPPNTPNMPWPADGATGESVYAMLRWSCSDPDEDDLMYKVYLGTVPNLSEENVIALGITDENLDLGMLEFNTTYYWKITAHDGELTTTSPVWSFTTEISNR